MRRVRSHLTSLLALTTAISASEVFAQSTFTEHGATVLNGLSISARSASLADIDNDGDLDLLFQGENTSARILMRNNFVGTGTLTYTTISSFNSNNLTLSSSWSAGWGDYDGDGFVDVFVGQANSGSTASGQNRGDALRNNGDGTFTNRSVAIGLNDPGFHQNIAWSDINNDGYLDMVIGMEGPEKHEIYLQSATGQFTPVGASVGFQVNYGDFLDATKAYGMAIGDTDGDGDMDIYISTCNQGYNLRNNFYENQLAQTGVLSFIDIAGNGNGNGNGTQNWNNSYHSEFIDFDDDGDLDLFNVGADGTPTRIFRNDGGNQFTNVADIIGRQVISDFAGDLNGGRAIDYDNDGDLDLFMHDNLSANGSNQARKLYRNDGNWNFTDVTLSTGLDSSNQGAYDSVWGDIDLDGDLDLIAPTRSGFTEKVFLSNASTNGNNWFYLRLDGTTENTTAIGASVYATINEGTPTELTLRREANTSAGAFNQSDLPVHFGLGTASLIDTLRIVWPDGTTQILHDVAVNQYLDLSFPGDFNGDHVVDASDLAQWRTDFGVGGGSDANGDGSTDGNDFLAWQRSFGRGVRPAPAAGSVPEPAAATLLLAGLIAVPLARRRFR